MKRFAPIVVGVLLFALILRNVNIPDTLNLLKTVNWGLLALALFAYFGDGLFERSSVELSDQNARRLLFDLELLPDLYGHALSG